MSVPQTAATQRLEQFTANPRRALWVLSLPIMFGMSIQTLYMIVDMVFVGRVSADALTALAFNMPVVFLITGSTFGLGTAITALVAQAVGARDRDQANALGGHTIVLGVLMAATFVAIGLLYGRDLLRLLGVPAALEGLAWSYFEVMIGGFPFMVTAVFLRSILSGEGEVRAPVLIQSAATLVNIALDPVFIFTLDLGVRGAALATVVAQVSSALALVYLQLVRRDKFVELSLRRLSPERRIFSQIFQIGIPASLSFLVMSLGGGAFNRVLVEFSSDAVAAHQIGGRLDHVVILPLVAMAASLVTLVGMFYGARRFDLLKDVVRYAIVRSMAIGLAVGALFFWLAPALVAIFSDSAEIRRLSVLYVRTVAFAYPFFGVSMLTGRCLQGLGQGTPELLLSLLRVVLIAVPLALFFAFVLELSVHWVWIAMLIASVTTALIAALWLRSGLARAIARADSQSELDATAPSPA